MKQQNQIEWKEVEFGNPEYFGVKKGESITKDKVTEGKIPVVAGGQQPAYYHNKSNRPGETITVSGSGAYAGFVNYFKEPIFASDCSTVQIKNILISSKYIYLFLKFYQDKIYLMQKGIAQPHVYPKDIIKIKIPLPFSNGKPDLKEQERIVSILEKAEKIKTKGDNAGKLLDEYLKSVFNEMFYNKGFEEVKLGDEKYFEIIMGQSPAGTSYNKTGKGMPFFQGKKEFGEKYPSVEQWTTEPSKLANPNDILISVRAPVGSINLANIKCCIGRGLASIRCKEDIKMDFVYSFLKVKEKEIENLGNGSTFKAITSGQLLGIKIPLPPLPLQQKFASIVEQIEKMKDKINQTKQNSEELFNSLMMKAFRGEL